MTTVYLSSKGYYQQDNSPCHKAQILPNWFHDNEFTVLKWTQQWLDINPTEHFWDVVEWGLHIMDVKLKNLQKLHDAVT